MCLIVFALDCHPRYRLILAANRDEYFNRPTAPAAFWEDAPQVLAGRDLLAGGTWLGATRDGRLAAVTYYREPVEPIRQLPSRGALAADFLAGTLAPDDYLEDLRRKDGRYGGFNLLFGNDHALYYHTNRGNLSGPVAAGVHGLSNGLLDTPWPKVVAAKEQLGTLLEDETVPPDALFALLADRRPFPDPLLPDTGFGIERERHLSPIFIAGSDYGSRSSTVILIERDGHLTFLERTWNERQEAVGTASFVFGARPPLRRFP
ncbi:MAG TPA: NRDE family protein [Geobacteraceae bacterium]|nr:NRDE family protein [Geobacteraceae bacterium]